MGRVYVPSLNFTFEEKVMSLCTKIDFIIFWLSFLLSQLAQKNTTNRIMLIQGLIIIRSERNTFIIPNQNKRI